MIKGALHSTICNIYNTGTSALPDMYAQAQGQRAAPKGKCKRIWQSMCAYITTNKLHFRGATVFIS